MVHDWSGAKRTVRFIGYNREHSVCYIRDQSNTLTAIVLNVPKLFDIRFREFPVGKDGVAAISVTRSALHLPACFGSEADKNDFESEGSLEAQIAFRMQIDAWKVTTPHKSWLTPQDDEKLKELLQQQLNLVRQEYQRREKAITARSASKAEKKKERGSLKLEFTTFRRNPQSQLVSDFDATLADVHQGWRGVRERYLYQEWAEHHGLNLNTVAADAQAFRIWLEKSAFNAKTRTTDLTTRTVEHGFGLSLAPWQWEVLEAAISYEIKFADGTRAWLDNISERPITDPDEIAVCEQLEKSQRPPGPPAWHTPGFTAIIRRAADGKDSQTLHLPNEFRALCLLLSERPNCTAQFVEIEGEIGTRTNQLDTEANAAKPSLKGERRIRDLLRIEAGKTLEKWGVLTTKKVGRDKFLTLSPPKPL
jgi:hypothetical protein